jgi:hypothetical protein
MPGGNRTGPLGQGSKTGRSLGYCTGNDFPGYTKRSPAGAGRKLKNITGCRQKMNCRAGQNFKCKRAFGFGRSEEAAGQMHYGNYPATYREQAESEVEFFEKRVNLLKQELETLYRRLKTDRLPEGGRQE